MRIMVLELEDQDSPIFDKIMEVVKCCPDIEHIRIKDEPMLSLPGLEIYPGRRKIYRDRREINLTAKEYDILSLLVANKGQVLTYDQIYSKVWGEYAFGDESNRKGRSSRWRTQRNVRMGIRVIPCLMNPGRRFTKVKAAGNNQA